MRARIHIRLLVVAVVAAVALGAATPPEAADAAPTWRRCGLVVDFPVYVTAIRAQRLTCVTARYLARRTLRVGLGRTRWRWRAFRCSMRPIDRFSYRLGCARGTQRMRAVVVVVGA